MSSKFFSYVKKKIVTIIFFSTQGKANNKTLGKSLPDVAPKVKLFLTPQNKEITVAPNFFFLFYAIFIWPPILITFLGLR